MATVKPKKHLGQHFLKDRNIAIKIVKALSDFKPEEVLEVGPGTGILTSLLLDKYGDNYHAVEIDRESIEHLIQKYPDIKNSIIDGDFLKLDIRKLYERNLFIIGNFPYNISSQIFFKILENRQIIQGAVGMIQKEVAERITSVHGNKSYGILSVLLQAFYDVEYLFPVSPKVFVPPPKVISAVIRLKRNDVYQLSCDEDFFFRIVKTAFNFRRKTLRNALKSILINLQTPEEVFNLRPEQLSVKEFIELTNLINEKIG